MSFSRIRCQMIRVISSPSISTIGFLTTILGICFPPREVLWLRDLAAGRTVEDPPQREVGREILVMMRHAGRDEQQIAGLERIPPVPMHEDAAAANYCIDLILRVRRLFVRRHRNRKLHVE